jgi:hypothetical protein
MHTKKRKKPKKKINFGNLLIATFCDKVCQWFFPGTLVSSTYKTDLHDKTEKKLKVVLNTINQTITSSSKCLTRNY